MHLFTQDDLVAGASWPSVVSFEACDLYCHLLCASILAADPFNKRISNKEQLPFAERLAFVVLLNQERTGVPLWIDTVNEIVARWLDAYLGRIHLREYSQVPGLVSLMEREVEAAVEKVFVHRTMLRPGGI